MIKIENLTCKYDENTILENINIEIEPSKITFIIGENGTGKSSLAKIITGLNFKYSGKVYIDNELITKKTKIEDLRKKTGIVFQNPDNGIVFNKVYDDVKFILDNLNIKENVDKIIEEALKTVNMEKHINSITYNLSGGEKQRIGIASVLALNPKYIIFDESTSMLDINGKKEIYKIINNLKSKNIGIIFITNIMDELIYADEIIILSNKKAEKYTKKEILNNTEILKKHNLKIPVNLKLIEILRKKGIKASNEEEILKGIISLWNIQL